ncbi:hypothetical protein [Citricoccus sp.]|uniref:hypothetical protein n=1 Tax=Citricoccus sp. TaxID=1978372 RepID=UPI0028BE3364|nr:hypothetical protein [Citricoccus sp.]
MELLGGTLAGLAGMAIFVGSFWVVCKANHDHRIPWLRRPARFPRRVYAYRVVAVVLLLLAVRAWAEVLGTWSVLVIVLPLIPIAVLNGQHNRRVALASSP